MINDIDIGDMVLIDEGTISGIRTYNTCTMASPRHWYRIISASPLIIAMPKGHGIPLENMNSTLDKSKMKLESPNTTFAVIYSPTHVLHLSKKYRPGDLVKTINVLAGPDADKFYPVVNQYSANSIIIAVPRARCAGHTANWQWPYPKDSNWVDYLNIRYPDSSFPIVSYSEIKEAKQYRSVYTSEFDNGENKCVSF